MPYSNMIDRGTAPSTLLAGDVGALIPEEVSREIIKGTYEKSAALRFFRHKDMGTAQTRMPVLAALPTAYFVTAPTTPATGQTLSTDIGWKQTTDMGWNNVYLNAEEIAAIVPIPEKILDDSSYDLWGEIKPAIEEAIAIALDAAIFFDVTKPGTWPAAIVPQTVTAGNQVVAGTGVDYLADVNAAMGAVEADGFFPSGFFARMQVKAHLRGLRDAQRSFLFNPDNQPLKNMPIQFGTLFGEEIVFSRGGFAAFTNSPNNISMILGDFNQAIIGVRQDISVKMLDQAIITSNADPPVILFNLPQQDMVAMRVVARYAFAVPNPVNRLSSEWPPVARYPFATVKQKLTTGGEA